MARVVARSRSLPFSAASYSSSSSRAAAAAAAAASDTSAGAGEQPSPPPPAARKRWGPLKFGALAAVAGAIGGAGYVSYGAIPQKFKKMKQ